MPEPHVSPSPEGVPGAVTDPASVVGEDLTFAGADGTQINGYLARPADSDPAHPGNSNPADSNPVDSDPANSKPARPGMIVIHEAMGLNDHIRDISNRFAQLGYVALGVDLYTREGGPPPHGDLQAMMARLFAMSDATVLGDLEGAADFLGAREDVTNKIGCIGFCMGGRFTLLFACSSDRLSAAVDCWGGFIDKATPDQPATPERPTPPLELAGKLHCPLLAAVGAEDQNPSPELAKQLRERAAASGQEVKVDVYEDAGHAFFADYRPNYRPAAAAKLWEQIVPFLAAHLQG
jgi:carboxymethylenebutenolidase